MPVASNAAAAWILKREAWNSMILPLPNLEALQELVKWLWIVLMGPHLMMRLTGTNGRDRW
jgi:hypothetical protein